MAIPFHLPTDEETQDNYRRLDQLLLDLYHVLRQILLRPPSSHSADRDRGEGGGEGGVPAPSGSRPVDDVSGSRRHRHQHRLDPGLPDVVSSTLHCRCARERRRTQRRHWRRRNCCHDVSREQNPSLDTTAVAPVSRPSSAPARREENWLIVGEHLRKIAEEFKTSLRKEECSAEKDQDLKMEVKTSGLFSLLIPAHFRSSIWTTVILLVGWRLLARTR